MLIASANTPPQYPLSTYCDSHTIAFPLVTCRHPPFCSMLRWLFLRLRLNTSWPHTSKPLCIKRRNQTTIVRQFRYAALFHRKTDTVSIQPLVLPSFRSSLDGTDINSQIPSASISTYSGLLQYPHSFSRQLYTQHLIFCHRPPSVQESEKCFAECSTA